MNHNSLTHFAAKSLPQGKHSDGQGLWLVKRSKLRGKWMLRVVVHSKRREMGLGRWPDVSLSEARTLAEDARRTLRAGSDPVFERKKARAAGKPMTVKQAIDSCFEARKAELKGDGEAGRWMSPLKVHVIPKIGAYPVEKLDQHVLKALLSPIWHAKPEAAHKALNRLGLVLKHSVALGLDADLQATMKARALLGKQRRTTEHIPALPYEETPGFYRSLKSCEAASALALRFLLLTLARPGEIRFAVFTEIDDKVWTIPAERTKTDVERRIPLVAEAAALVAECRERSSNEFLFPAFGRAPISDAAMAKLMKDRGLSARPHGFRATFRTWVEEQTETPFEVKESALGHVVDTGVIGAYQRSDRLEKRRALLREWEMYLTSKR